MCYIDTVVLRKLESYVDFYAISESIYRGEVCKNNNVVDEKQDKLRKEKLSTRTSWVCESVIDPIKPERIATIFEILVVRRNEFDKCVTLLETEETNEPEETKLQCRDRVSAYNHMITYITVKYGIVEPEPKTKKLKSN